MNIVSPVAALAAACVLGGCALADANRENQQTEQRIAQKQNVLAAEQARHDRLVTQTKQLQQDLATKKMDAAQLNDRLDQIIASNQVTAAQTDAQRARRDDLNRQLTELKKRTQVLQNNPTLSNDAKERELADLKARTGVVLNLLMSG